MDNKLSELKDALEFLETTEFDGEWDSALVGGENGKNYHAVINANDVVVRADDDSRHTSWLCDYLEAVSPVNIRALLAELEAKDKRIVSIERINQAQDDHINQQQDRIDSLEKTNAGLGQRLGAAENRLATPVPTVKFAGYGLYHAERDEFGSWLKATPQGNCSDAITKHGYVNVKLFTAPPEPAVPPEMTACQAYDLLMSKGGVMSPVDSAVFAWNACRAAMLAQPVSGGYKLPPHVYRELVNSLRDTAVKFSGTEQLRERLNTALIQFIEPDHHHTRTVAPEGGNDHDTRR